MNTSPPFDHELKFRRAFTHLENLNGEIERWLNGDHHTVRIEPDSESRTISAFATAEQPPSDPISMLIGDCVHNLRAGLDNLAYALTSAFTSPLSDEIAESSEFPIFGDEDRQGNTGIGRARFNQLTNAGSPTRGSGLWKIRGWNPQAQAIAEALQPYHRGNDYRTDPLWILHELDRIDKHRLVHSVVSISVGSQVTIPKEIASGFQGIIEVFDVPVETDTPIYVLRDFALDDPSQEVYMQVSLLTTVAFAKGTPCVENEPVLETLSTVYDYVTTTVLDLLNPFL